MIFEVGQFIVVELKDDSEVKGVLESVDDHMNLIFQSACLADSSGVVYSSDFTNINGCKIRYVHLSPQVKPRAIVSDYIKKVDRNHFRSLPSRINDSKSKPSFQEGTIFLASPSESLSATEEVENGCNQSDTECMKLDDN